jgi:hypothetical protein
MSRVHKPWDPAPEREIRDQELRDRELRELAPEPTAQIA